VVRFESEEAVTTSTLLDLQQELLRVLYAVISERPTPRQLITRDGQTRSEFVFYERHALHVAVNGHRSSQNLPNIDVSEIEACEDEAFGLADYASKLALYCAELSRSRHPELRLAH
jgi:hypothetical protein